MARILRVMPYGVHDFFPDIDYAAQLADRFPSEIFMYIENEYSEITDLSRHDWYARNKMRIPTDLHDFLERWLEHTLAMEESI